MSAATATLAIPAITPLSPLSSHSAPSAPPLPLCDNTATPAQLSTLPTAALALATFFYTAAASLGRTFARLADPETEVDVKGTCQAIHAYRMLVNVAKELDAPPSSPFVVTPSGGPSSSSSSPSPGTPISASAPPSASPYASQRLCVGNQGNPSRTSPSALHSPLSTVTSPPPTPPSPRGQSTPVIGPAPFVSTRRRRP